jgi:hypothetical protein
VLGAPSAVAAWQVPPLHHDPGAQPPLPVQLVVQAAFMHRKAPQLGPLGAATHAPAPSQSWAVGVLSTHAGGAHTVPLGYLRHAPPPSHVPSSLQLAGASALQSPCGSAPFDALPQVPSTPPLLAAEHAWQTPLHAELQQTPSTQKPDWHWSAIVHAWPLGACATHAPLEQSDPCTQSRSEAHGLAHPLGWHW